jgi:hypothetical protein
MLQQQHFNGMEMEEPTVRTPFGHFRQVVIDPGHAGNRSPVNRLWLPRNNVISWDDMDSEENLEMERERASRRHNPRIIFVGDEEDEDERFTAYVREQQRDAGNGQQRQLAFVPPTNTNAAGDSIMSGGFLDFMNLIDSQQREDGQRFFLTIENI